MGIHKQGKTPNYNNPKSNGKEYIENKENTKSDSKTKVTDALNQALTLKWQWAGHVLRYLDNRRTIQTTQWKGPVGKRCVGRPFKLWADEIIQTAGKNWLYLGKDREKWKRLEEAFTRNGAHVP
nr:uncharacterized protein LOC117993998 [Maniola hyperantus]